MASVSKRRWKKPDGTIGEKWTVRYKDGGSYPQKSFELKKDAEAFRRKVEREIEDGTHVSRRASRTLTELSAEFIADLARRASDGLVGATYVGNMERSLRYACDALGTVVVADLKWQQVEQFGRDLRAKRYAKAGKVWSNATVRGVLAALNAAVDYGVRRGYAARNVVRDAIKEIGALPSKRIETFSLLEMKALVETIETPRKGALERTQALTRAIVYLGAMCGLRRGEILALDWKSIDFAEKQIVVRASLDVAKDTVKGPKTRSSNRTVPLPALVAEALTIWQRFVLEDDRGLIFRTRNRTAIRSRDFYNDLWHPLLDRAGFPPEDGRYRHFHATRHFAGSAWLDAGVPLPEVSRLLGHANMQVTARIYSHAIAEVHHRASQLNACAGALRPTMTQPLRIAA